MKAELAAYDPQLVVIQATSAWLLTELEEKGSPHWHNWLLQLQHVNKGFCDKRFKHSDRTIVLALPCTKKLSASA